MDRRKNVVLLGATGSIGSSAALELAYHRDKFNTIAVAANKSIGKLAETAIKLGAKTAVTGDVSLENELATALDGSGITVSGVNLLNGQNQSIVVYYTYYRK